MASSNLKRPHPLVGGAGPDHAPIREFDLCQNVRLIVADQRTDDASAKSEQISPQAGLSWPILVQSAVIFCSYPLSNPWRS